MKALEQKLEQKGHEAGQAVGALQVEAARALGKMEPFMQVSSESGAWRGRGCLQGVLGWGGVGWGGV